MSSKLKLIHGSGNVYRDFELPDADIRQTKALLAAQIIGVLRERHLTSKQASKPTGIDQKELDQICQPKLKTFTIDRLTTIPNQLNDSRMSLIC